MLKESSKIVFNYVMGHESENITAYDIANDTGLPIRTVNGVITQSFCRHRNADKEVVPLMERIPAELELPDGTHKPIKLIKMTDAGRSFDIEAACTSAEE